MSTGSNLPDFEHIRAKKDLQVYSVFLLLDAALWDLQLLINGEHVAFPGNTSALARCFASNGRDR